MPTKPGLVVFSHLRWDFVFQRPQHLLSRLAADRRVLFVEEPIQVADTSPAWALTQPAAGVTVARLTTPSPAPGFHDEHVTTFERLLPELLEREGMVDYLAWFYTPMALPLAQHLEPLQVIYDCMDELSAFKGAPPELLAREDALLARADLVFTGGPSLYRAKRARHPRVHCFPSSVDAAHFRAARDGAIEAAETADLPRPRLGFYGVIDERMDLELLAGVAEARPEWQIVMVGPVVKIEPDALPRHPNIHYLGQRSYEELPTLLAGWDVCLLPFALNEATRFISPTKTLEYMAAEKPIVSTPIADVVEPYGEIVYLGASSDAFVAACERALGASQKERFARVERMRSVLASTSWATTAAAMDELIQEQMAARSMRRVA
jgi:UDP-galactopyranose mutase